MPAYVNEAVIVAVPAFFPVILPPDTLATLLFDVDHDTEYPLGLVVAEIVTELP